MDLVSTNQVTISISEDAIDFDLYTKMTDFFQASGWYMKATYILPYRFVGGEVVVTVTGQTGVGYRLVVGDLEYDFFGSISVPIPADGLKSKITEITVYDTAFSVMAGTTVAFPYYVVFVYIMAYIILQFFGRLDKIKYGWYLMSNLLYPDLLEKHFGQLTDFTREAPWDYAEYREAMTCWVDSFMKYPAIRRGFIQCVNSMQYKDWLGAKLCTWHTTMGRTRMPTIDKWVVSPAPGGS